MPKEIVSMTVNHHMQTEPGMHDDSLRLGLLLLCFFVKIFSRSILKTFLLHLLQPGMTYVTS